MACRTAARLDMYAAREKATVRSALSSMRITELSSTCATTEKGLVAASSASKHGCVASDRTALAAASDVATLPALRAP